MLIRIFALSLSILAATSQPVSILPGHDSDKPVSIAADRLDYFEKDNKAIYEGHVIVVQGDSRLSCSRLTIFMEARQTQNAAPPSQDTGASSRLKHMDCVGPVKVVSKDQTATSDAGTYDKKEHQVVLTGHVVMSDGKNVTRGERLVYDLKTGTAHMQGGRVTGFFLPHSETKR